MIFTKGQLILAYGEDQLKCICADHEYAVFARVSRRYDSDGKDFINTDFEKISVFDNAGNAPIEYETIACENLIQ